jgi:hypothetical protein
VWGWSRTTCGRLSKFSVDLPVGRNVLPYHLHLQLRASAIKRTLNPEFISSLTSWIFQETGVVKVLSTEHYRIREAADGGSENGTIKETRDRFKGYTVKEDVVSPSHLDAQAVTSRRTDLMIVVGRLIRRTRSPWRYTTLLPPRPPP